MGSGALSASLLLISTHIPKAIFEISAPRIQMRSNTRLLTVLVSLVAAFSLASALFEDQAGKDDWYDQISIYDFNSLPFLALLILSDLVETPTDVDKSCRTLQNIGKLRFAQFDSRPGREFVYVVSEQGVVASLSTAKTETNLGTNKVAQLWKAFPEAIRSYFLRILARLH
jgi:hypothetical protein